LIVQKIVMAHNFAALLAFTYCSISERVRTSSQHHIRIKVYAKIDALVGTRLERTGS
jgi:hypothetical protein